MRGFSACLAVCLAASSAWSPAAAQSTFGTQVLLLSPAVRSCGMGETGVADAADPLNAFYNPAVIAAAGEVFFAGAYSPLPRDFSDDVYGLQAAVGAGFSFAAGDAIGLRAGGSVAFSRLDYDDYFHNDCPSCTWLIEYRPGLEQALSFTVGGEANYRERVRLGIGLAVKPVWYRREPLVGTVIQSPSTGSGVAYDLGFLLSADLLKRSELRLSTSAGFSILNMGGDIEFSGDHYTDVLPRRYRAGLGLRLEGPRTIFLGNELPIGALSVNCDMSDREVSEMVHANGDYWGAGMEASLLEMLFARFGYFDERYFEGAFDAEDFTFGVGVGLTAKAARVRLDYATVPQPAGLQNADKFGLTCGFNF